MTSTAISTFLAYTPPVVVTHCGDIYCSQNLDYFLINCTTCSQEFNLLSCNLFINHIKECVPHTSDSLDPGDQQNSEDQNPTNPENSNFCIDNLLKDALKNNNIEPIPNQKDPLMSFKLEIVKEKDEVGYKHSPTHMSPKTVPTHEQTSDATSSEPEDVEFLSDYQDEDDLTIDKVIRRKMIEGIIDEYKKHPILWDTRYEKNANRAAKNHHYKQIRKAVNAKFKKNFTHIELIKLIHNLRSGYRRVLKNKEKFDKHFANDETMRFNPQLWYFDKISFIQGTSNDIEPDEDGLLKVEITDDGESSDSTIEQSRERNIEKRERPTSKILSEPMIISDIINQYKQFSFLWDQTASLYNDKYARKDAYRQITSFINKKFNKNVTDKEMRRQVVNLRSAYRRAQRKKHKANYRITLWYFDKLSFIDKKSEQTDEDACQQIPEEPLVDEKTLLEVSVSAETVANPFNAQSLNETQNNEITAQQSDDHNYEDEDDDDFCGGDGDSQASHRIYNKSVTINLIEEYKRFPCLWNNYLYKTSSRFNRYDAIKAITNTINTKLKTSFTDTEIKNKLAQLRSSYRRVLRKKEAFEKKHANAKRIFHPQLWYFDRMTFIGAKESDFSVSRRKKRKIDSDKQCQKEEEEEDDKSEEDSDSDFPEENEEEDSDNVEEMSDDESKDEKSITKITKNRELLTNMIEEYKKLPCLWAVKYYTNDNLARRRAFTKLAQIINTKFNTEFTYKEIRKEIAKLRSTYNRMLRRKQDCSDGEFKTKMWYADMLSFLNGGKLGDLDEDDERLMDQWNFNDASIDDVALESNSPRNGASEDDEIHQRKSRLKKKEHVFEIIELYKSAPILWDTKHHQHVLRSERKKAVEKIIATLSMEHDCLLTAEEFRYQIRFLRESYFRAVRHEISARQGDISSRYAVKPFFFDRMSFLEPFADKTPFTLPDLQVSAAKESSENFTFLIENRALMMDFIELYKIQGCLWDQRHKDRNNPSAHEDAYDKIINLFLQNDVIYTKDNVLSAISFLHATVVNTQKAFECYNTDNTSEEPIWFYEHLKFLGRIPRIKDKYCTHCDQHFRTITEYEKHKIEIAGDYPYKCSVCNAGFVSRSKYAYHQITHKEPHKCKLCGFQAYDRHNFNVHMRRHKGITPFKCEHCEKGFVTSTELNRHLRMHTGEKPFICDICGKPLAANSEFHQHMKRHRNQRDHKCEVCGSAFFTPKTLRDHMASHSAERQHVCDVCGAAFKRKKTLHQHKALHSEHKKHECKICGKLFAQKAGVYSHMKSHGLIPGS